ncbi:MAG: hypothetical protein Q8K92_13405 [Leadbetterella sp.]|nr:hypothetical protein [Leadbetterella sp.]
MNLEIVVKKLIRERVIQNSEGLTPGEVDSLVEFVLIHLANNLNSEDLIQRFKSLNKRDWDILLKEYQMNSHLLDDRTINFIKPQERINLKEKLINWDSNYDELIWDSQIEKSFQLAKRHKLKNTLKQLEEESQGPKTLKGTMFYIKRLSIAASIIIAFAIWQPQHLSDNTIFNNYSIRLDKNTFLEPSEFADGENGNDIIRGEDFYFNGYTAQENEQIKNGVFLIKNKEFNLAKETFLNIGIPKTGSDGPRLYLAIAQLNSGDFNDAILNFEYLKKIPKFIGSEQVDFYLALAYLKAGERAKSKENFKIIADKKENIFQNDAATILKKLRWF